MSKKWTRRSALGLIGSGAGLLTWGTGGFTEVQGSRDVFLDADNDSDALLGLDGTSVSGVDGKRVSLTTLTNRFDEDITNVTVTLDTLDPPLTIVQTPSKLPANGGTGDITAELDCGGSTGQENVDITITATGPSQSVELQRQFTIDCVEPRVSYWDFEQITSPEDGSGTSVPDVWDSGSLPVNDGQRSPEFLGYAFNPIRRVYGYRPSVRQDQTRGSHLDFSQDSDPVSIPDDPSLDLTGEFSLSVWVYLPSSQTGISRLFSKWDPGSAGYQLWIDSNSLGNQADQLAIETQDDYEFTGTSLATGTWTHLVWSHGSSNDTVYVDGSVVYDQPALADPAPSDPSLLLGNGPDGPYGYDGYMDDAKVYDKALTTSEVENLYETSKGGDGGSII
jgi:hypothetical protein